MVRNGQAQKLIELSGDFLDLVRESVQDHSVDETRQAVAFWCQNQPLWYQQFVWDSLSLPPRCDPQIANRRCPTQAVAQLATKLRQMNAMCLFLMEDGRLLAEAYSDLGGDPMLVTYGRRSLPGDRLTTYFTMFGLVNRAARQAQGDWHAFRDLYGAEFAALLKTDIGRAIDRSIGACLQGGPTGLWHHIAAGKPVVLVDTGMQGTFVSALDAWLQQRASVSQDQVDIHILAAYPWLGELYRERCISTSTAVVAAIEDRLTVAA